MNEILNKLSAPFPADEIEWRIGSKNKDGNSGMVLAYITARHVMDRLDRVVGSENWQDRYEFHGPRTVCYLSIRVDGEWITKADAAGDSAVEKEKGSVSDALKRAAVKWGIARYLYDLENIWADLELRGRTTVIKKSEFGRLEKLLNNRFSCHSKAYERDEVLISQEENQSNQPIHEKQNNEPVERRSKDDAARKIYEALQANIDKLENIEKADAWGKNNASYIHELPLDWEDAIRARFKEKRTELKSMKEAA